MVFCNSAAVVAAAAADGFSYSTTIRGVSIAAATADKYYNNESFTSTTYTE